MTPELLFVLTWLGNISVLVAIGCLAWHIAMGMWAMTQGRDEDVPNSDNAAWVGLACFGLWMACQIGRIGF